MKTSSLWLSCNTTPTKTKSGLQSCLDSLFRLVNRLYFLVFTDTRPADDFGTNPYNGDGGGYPPTSAPAYDDYPDSRPYPGEMEQPYYSEEDEMIRRMDALNVGAPPGDGYHPDDRHSPSIDGRPPGE